MSAITPEDYTIKEHYGFRLAYKDGGKPISPIYPDMITLRKFFYEKYYRRSQARVLTPSQKQEAIDNISNMEVRKYRYRPAPRSPVIDVSKLLKKGDVL